VKYNGPAHTTTYRVWRLLARKPLTIDQIVDRLCPPLSRPAKRNSTRTALKQYHLPRMVKRGELELVGNEYRREAKRA